jgi:uroporphyrinogen-III decarboxylase
MNTKPRDRVIAALERRPPDGIPVRIYAAAGGLHEHGQKLVDLIKHCGHDFGDFSALDVPEPPGPSDYDSEGHYHAFRRDEWGVEWEYRTFGVWGCPVEYPLDDLSRLDVYRPPEPPACEGEAFEHERTEVAKARRSYYTIGGGGSFFEQLHSVRRFEDVLVDIALDTPEIHRISDMLIDYAAAKIRRAIALGVDAVSFGDDFGTQNALMLSPEQWRRFFKPRYEALFRPVKEAGKKVLFHCCGKIGDILADFRDVGVDVIWPQLPAFDTTELARTCRDLGLTVELHPDRGDLMQHGTPSAIRDYILRLVNTFGTREGGSWLYLEVDPGFPWRNVEALFETARELRQGSA